MYPFLPTMSFSDAVLVADRPVRRGSGTRVDRRPGASTARVTS